MAEGLLRQALRVGAISLRVATGASSQAGLGPCSRATALQDRTPKPRCGLRLGARGCRAPPRPNPQVVPSCGPGAVAAGTAPRRCADSAAPPVSTHGRRVVGQVEYVVELLRSSCCCASRSVTSSVAGRRRAMTFSLWEIRSPGRRDPSQTRRCSNAHARREWRV